MSRPPRVAVIVPVRGAHATIQRCLESLAEQTFRDFETIVVDDGAGSGTADLIVSRFPELRHLHVPGAGTSALRDLGAGASAAPLLAFTEPDAYARPDWLERMVRAHDDTGEAIAGAIDCFGRRWLDRAVHLCNFAKWLPAEPRREVDVAPGATVVVTRRDYVAAGGFPGERFIGEVLFSHALRARGRGIILEPGAVVEHHYSRSFGEFVGERSDGGTRYGMIQARQRRNDRVELLWWLAVTALPFRLAQFSLRLVSSCRRAGRLRDLVATSPVVLLGLCASLAGEALAYSRLFVAARR
jgi:glycosyltransferase involved in cell wall biosynthesis